MSHSTRDYSCLREQSMSYIFKLHAKFVFLFYKLRKFIHVRCLLKNKNIILARRINFKESLIRFFTNTKLRAQANFNFRTTEPCWVAVKRDHAINQDRAWVRRVYSMNTKLDKLQGLVARFHMQWRAMVAHSGRFEFWHIY